MKYIEIKKFKKYDIIKILRRIEGMEYTVEDIRRIMRAKSSGTIRNILCLPEFEKKRSFNYHRGKALIYSFNAQDLKRIREILATRRIIK